MKLLYIATAMTAAIVYSTTAYAAIITKTFDFTASDFSRPSGPNVVIPNQVSGSFTVTFDNAISVNNATGVIVNSIDTPYTGSVLYRYTVGQGNIAFGANGNVGALAVGTNDFFLGIGDIFGSEPNKSGSFTFVTTTNYFTSQAANVVINERVAVVPEPATWAMLFVGFGMIGAAARYRRRGVQVRYA